MKRQEENLDQLVASLYQKLLSLESKHLHIVQTCSSVLEEKQLKLSEEELNCPGSMLPSLKYQKKRIENELELLKKSQIDVESTGEIQKIYAEILNRIREVEDQMIEITGNSCKAAVKDTFKSMVSFIWKLIFNRTEACKNESSGKAPKYKAMVNSLIKEKTFVEEQLRKTVNENAKIRTQMKTLKQSVKQYTKQLEKAKISTLKQSPRLPKSPKPRKALKISPSLSKTSRSAEPEKNLDVSVIIKYSHKILGEALQIEKQSATKGKIEKYRASILKYIKALSSSRDTSPSYRNTPERLRNLSMTSTFEQMATNTIQNLQRIQLKLLESEKKVHSLASKVKSVHNHRAVNQLASGEIEIMKREHNAHIYSLNEEIKNLLNQTELTSNENTVLKNDLLMYKEKHDEVVERNLFLEDKMSAGNAGANPVLEWEIQQLRRDVDTKESEIEQLNRIIEQMDEEFSNSECQKCFQLLKQLDEKSGEQEVMKMKKGFDQLVNQYNSLYTQFYEIESLLKISEEKCATLKAKKSKYKAMCLNASTHLENPEKDLHIVEEENTVLKRCIEEYKQTFSKLKEENTQLTRQIADLNRTSEEHSKNTDESVIVKQLQYELDKTKKDFEELSSRLNDSENSSTQELKSKLKSAKLEKHSSEVKLKELTDQLHAKTSFINTAYTFILKTHSQLSELTEDLYNLEPAELEARISQCLRDLSIIQSGYKHHNDRNAISAIEDAFTSKNSEISRLTTLVARQDPEKYKEKIKSLKQELTRNMAENKVLSLKLEETLNSIQQMIFKLDTDSQIGQDPLSQLSKLVNEISKS